MRNCERVIYETCCETRCDCSAVRRKLAYFADYHEIHERVNCVICEMDMENKTRNARADKRLSVMRACMAWLRHQHTAEENLLDRYRQKRR